MLLKQELKKTERKEKNSKLADKPGSVVDSHSSNTYITARL